MSMSVARRAGVAAGVVAVLAGALASCSGGAQAPPRPGVRLAAPAYVADPVPKDERRTKSDLPGGHCGIGTATLRSYVPDVYDDDFGHGGCFWTSVRDEPSGADHERELLVTFEDPLTSGDDGASAGGDALRALDPAADPVRMATGTAPRPVSGIGDEALYTYAAGAADTLGRDVGAELRFRAGATLVRVAYRGNDRPEEYGDPKRQVPEKEARRAVLAGATDVAKALHVPAKPVVTSPATAVPPPAPRTVRPCDLLPAAVAETLAAGAIRQGTRNVTETAGYGEAVASCSWDVNVRHRPERHLRVRVDTESEWRPGIAAGQAKRRYLEWHDDARDAAAKDFHAVRNLGDQAYAVYVHGEEPGDENHGEVGFRYRDRVVQVSYSGGDDGQIRETGDRPLGKNTAINGAYTAATHILEALR